MKRIKKNINYRIKNLINKLYEYSRSVVSNAIVTAIFTKRPVIVGPDGEIIVLGFQGPRIVKKFEERNIPYEEPVKESIKYLVLPMIVAYGYIFLPENISGVDSFVEGYRALPQLRMAYGQHIIHTTILRHVTKENKRNTVSSNSENISEKLQLHKNIHR